MLHASSSVASKRGFEKARMPLHVSAVCVQENMVLFQTPLGRKGSVAANKSRHRSLGHRQMGVVEVICTIKWNPRPKALLEASTSGIDGSKCPLRLRGNHRVSLKGGAYHGERGQECLGGVVLSYVFPSPELSTILGASQSSAKWSNSSADARLCRGPPTTYHPTKKFCS